MTGIQGVQGPVEVSKEVSAENEIISLVSEICWDIDPTLLSDYLVNASWDKILGKSWAHHKTYQEKANALALQAKVTIKVPIARTILKK